jgi:molecular chaperone DnaK (HSP70)
MGYIFSFKEQKMPSIAIDLGTSNTRVAVWQNGAIKVIKNELGYRTTPSCVAFTATERLIGDAAKSQVNFRLHCMIVSSFFVRYFRFLLVYFIFAYF